MASVTEFFSNLPSDPHESRQPSIIALYAVAHVTATISVALRLWARRLINVRLDSSDYCILAALFSAYGLLISAMQGFHYGYGKHLFDFDLSNVTPFLKNLYAYIMIYCVCLPLVKISIMLFLKRIFPTRGFTIASNITIGVLVVWSVQGLVVTTFQCQPISSFWDRSIEGHCINEYVYIMINAVITVITDVVILVMPMPLVWGLKIARVQKVGLSCIFLLGSMVCIASIIRIPTLHLLFSVDATWTIYEPSMWSCVEVNLGIVCACLPVMRPLVRKMRVPQISSWGTAGSYDRSGERSGDRGLHYDDGAKQGGSSKTREWWPMETVVEAEHEADLAISACRPPGPLARAPTIEPKQSHETLSFELLDLPDFDPHFELAVVRDVV